MLKKTMKKFFANMYVFSKFSMSFILLFCLIFALYILYQNYQKQEKNYSNNKIVEQNISKNIDQNFKSIKQISNEIEMTKNSLKKIEESITNMLSSDKNDQILKLNSNVEFLTNKLSLLSKEIQAIKKNSVENNLIKEDKNSSINSRSEVIDLILIKFENNINFDKELKFLEEIIGPTQNNSIEKIHILLTKPFFGYTNLENKFNEEVNLYLKNRIGNNNSIFLNKVLLPYINISPSSENKIDDNTIELIKKIKFDIKNRSIGSAYKNILQVKDDKKLFSVSISEMKKLIDFEKLLNNLK